MNKQTFKSAFTTLVVLFFLWGFLTSLNDILVPHMKAAFDLKHWQAQLVQFFFFGAYFVMSWPSGMLIQRVGYQRGIVAGLALMGLGCFTFYPASVMVSYPIFLVGLFILASGITILQVAANPYVSVLGSEETAASRLNLAQGFNSLGHTIAPIFGAAVILSNQQETDINSVKMPYIGLGLILAVIAIIFLFIKLPKINQEATSEQEKFSLFKYPHLFLGALAIFFYVGAEIAVGSLMVEYLKLPSVMSFDSQTAGYFVAYYWGGAMVGRFLGAISMSETTNKVMKMAAIIIGAMAFLFIAKATSLINLEYNYLLGFCLMLIINFILFQLGKSIPARVLMIFAFAAISMLAISMLTNGHIAMWTILSIGLFNSIMWSNIFTLAIRKLGKDTSYGSSILVMMIAGGAILPVLQGLVADISFFGVKYSYIIPLLAYLYIAYYGTYGYKIKNQIT